MPLRKQIAQTILGEITGRGLHYMNVAVDAGITERTLRRMCRGESMDFEKVDRVMAALNRQLVVAVRTW